MANEGDAVRLWAPQERNFLKNALGRYLSIPCYLLLVPFIPFHFSPSTVENAYFHRRLFGAMFVGFGVLGHGLLWRKYASRPLCKQHLIGQYAMLFVVDLSYGYLTMLAHWLTEIYSINRKDSRILSGRLHGPRVLICGNGPSACEGKPLGHEIDKFDEVVRFNNFKCKADGLEKWVGTKTTVHFSDGCLYPTFKDYFSPGADVILSLFVDRLVVSFSYLILRAGPDLELDLTRKFFQDPSTVWIPVDTIRRLQRDLGIEGNLKHPTSGMLAIDWFLRQPNVQLPIYITGFDFFQGKQIHYYHKQEPLYERINNHIGVNLLHAPHLEKIYVQKLIDQGKVKFLKDEF